MAKTVLVGSAQGSAVPVRWVDMYMSCTDEDAPYIVPLAASSTVRYLLIAHENLS